MTVYCPRDSKPCVDDFCHSGTCFPTDGPTLERCSDCGALFNAEEPCDCDEREYDNDEDLEEA